MICNRVQFFACYGKFYILLSDLFLKRFISVVVPTYLYFINFNQVTFLMHSNVFIGSLSLIWFAFSNTTLMGGDWRLWADSSGVPNFYALFTSSKREGEGQNWSIYLVMFFWSLMSDSTFPKAQSCKWERACCEKECQGWIPAFHRASSRANVSETSFQSTKKVPCSKC